MRFSIIMQSFLGDYKFAATNREAKLVRAIDSVIAQTFTDWELIIIADGCEKTFDIVEEKYKPNLNIDCRLINKQTIWGGAQRNYGISLTKGELICYLDNDDYFGENHLQIINDNIGELDWAFFNDICEGKERESVIQVKGNYGTSNIVHKKSLGAKWTSYGYGTDDWGLVEHLKKLSSNFGKIRTAEYIVCHIPNRLDV